MMVSVHIPKTAGGSLREILKQRFNEHLVLDYRSNLSRLSKFQSAVSIAKEWTASSLFYRPLPECVHGHFPAMKYLSYGIREPLTFIAFVRHPLLRLQSLYSYAKKTYDQSKDEPIKEWIVKSGISFEEFLLHSNLQNSMARFFGPISPDRFSFIGLTENFSADADYLMQSVLGIKSEVPQVNVLSRKPPSLDAFSKDLLAKAEAFHAKDMDLYNYVVSQRKKGVFGARLPSDFQIG